MYVYIYTYTGKSCALPLCRSLFNAASEAARPGDAGRAQDLRIPPCFEDSAFQGLLSKALTVSRGRRLWSSHLHLHCLKHYLNYSLYCRIFETRHKRAPFGTSRTLGAGRGALARQEADPLRADQVRGQRYMTTVLVCTSVVLQCSEHF